MIVGTEGLLSADALAAGAAVACEFVRIDICERED